MKKEKVGKLAFRRISCFRYRWITVLNSNAFEAVRWAMGKCKLDNYFQDAPEVCEGLSEQDVRSIV